MKQNRADSTLQPDLGATAALVGQRGDTEVAGAAEGAADSASPASNTVSFKWSSNSFLKMINKKKVAPSPKATSVDRLWGCSSEAGTFVRKHPRHQPSKTPPAFRWKTEDEEDNVCIQITESMASPEDSCFRRSQPEPRPESKHVGGSEPGLNALD